MGVNFQPIPPAWGLLGWIVENWARGNLRDLDFPGWMGERNAGTGHCGRGFQPLPSVPWKPRELTVPKKSVSGVGLG